MDPSDSKTLAQLDADITAAIDALQITPAAATDALMNTLSTKQSALNAINAQVLDTYLETNDTLHAVATHRSNEYKNNAVNSVRSKLSQLSELD